MARELSAFPDYELMIKETDGKSFVLDSIRRKWVRLTQEENVRQHLLCALKEHGYPPGLTSVEKEFAVSNRGWRADVAVYDRASRPILLAECKAPAMPINQDVFDQLARYNTSIGAGFILATNGNRLLVAAIKDTSIEFLDQLPQFNDLIALAGRSCPPDR